MSYDLWLEIDTGGSKKVEVYDWNYTSNSARAWCHAGADLAQFDGKSAGDCAPILAAAIEKMLADPDTYRAMDAPNGWGTYDTLLLALTALLEAMRAHPATTVRIWR